MIGFLNYFVSMYFSAFRSCTRHKKQIFTQAILFEMQNGKNMIHFRILPIGLRNAARASTRQQQRPQQSQSGPEFNSTATHSTPEKT